LHHHAGLTGGTPFSDAALAFRIRGLRTRCLHRSRFANLVPGKRTLAIENGPTEIARKWGT
jgi:hypothetical protein